MRKFVLSSLAALMLTATACQPADPNAFETHLPKLVEPDSRAEGMDGISRLVKVIATSDNQERKKEFGEKVIPKFLEMWDEAKEHRPAMLEMMRDVGVTTPEAEQIWSKAVVLDGTTEARAGALVALQGVRDANATGVAEAIRTAFDGLIDNPANDTGENTGEIRLEYAKTLGELRDAGSVDVLLKSLEQTADNQPVAVHKQAVEALALIGASDQKVIDALLTVQFRVPDSPGTQSIGERAARALAAIGEPAVPRVIQMLKGEIEAVTSLAAQNGVELLVTHQLAVKILGAIGSKAATADLVAFMPAEDCAEGAKPPASADDMDAAKVGLRAVVARSLGEIADPAASAALCGCRNATHNAGDLWEITMALGRIGGSEAFTCLTDIVANNEYNPADLVNSDFRYEIRWEGARWLILAAEHSDAAKIREVINGQEDPKVKENITKWEDGIKVLEECKDDKACYENKLTDPGGKWFAREVAAVQLARRSQGDAKAALDIANAFKVRDAGARVTMALLSAQVMDGKPCVECADALERVMESESGSAKAEMQAAWLTGRQSMAKLRSGAPASAPAAAAPAEKPAEEPAKEG